MGVRPEAIFFEDKIVSQSPETSFTALVEVVEMLGSETLLYLNINGLSAVARVSPLCPAKAGESFTLCIDGTRIQLFDKETEKVIARA
jgi:multiple sugar transport system ATP-binding protein